MPGRGVRRKNRSRSARRLSRRSSPAAPIRSLASVGRVSVLIPAFRSWKYLAESVRSVLQQELPLGWTIEVLVGVDGCRKTLEAALGLQQELPKIQVFYAEENAGAYCMRNYLFGQARGDVIEVVDADDVVPKNRLLVQLGVLEANPSVDLVGGAISVVDEKLKNPKHNLAPPEDPTGVYKHGNTYRDFFQMWSSHGTWLVRRRVFELLGGYAGWSCGADAEFYLRAVAHSDIRIFNVSNILLLRRTHEGQLTKVQGPSSEPRRRAVFRVLEAWKRYRKGSKPSAVQPVCAEAKRQGVHGRQGVLAVMPTIPSRHKMALRVIYDMLRQGADLRVFLNGFSKIPEEFPRTSRIEYILNRKRTGPVSRYSIPVNAWEFVLFVDDDIIYPSNYVSRVTKFLQAKGSCTALCWHASYWEGRFSSFQKARKVVAFTDRSEHERQVPYGGSGTMCLHAEVFDKIAGGKGLEHFEFHDDVWISASLGDLGVRLIRPPSESRWLRPNGEASSTLWNEAAKDGFVQRDAAIRKAMKLFRWKV